MTDGTRSLSQVLASYDGRRVLVTGGTGFVGRWVSKMLSDAGADLVILTRDGQRLASITEAYRFAATTLQTDLSSRGAFKTSYEEVRPAITFNLAGYGVGADERDPASMRRINADLVEEIAVTIGGTDEDDAWTGLRLVHVGSAFEYGPLDGMIVEDSTPEPNTPYGAAKLEGTRRLQQRCALSGLPAVTARIATVYGPGEHSHRLLPSLLRAASSGTALDLTAGRQERDFTYVEDVAEGLLRLGVARSRPYHVVNLATGRLASVRTFVETAAQVLGLSPDQTRFGAQPYRSQEVWQGPLSVVRLESALAWRPATTIRTGIARTRDFYAEHDRET